MKMRSGSSRRTLAIKRCRNPRLRTWPRCTSLISAAVRPRQASGRFSSCTRARVMRVQLAFQIPYNPEREAQSRTELPTDAMKVNSYASQSCDSEQNPGAERRQEQETQKAHPDGGALVEHPHRTASVGKGQNRGGHEADRQHPKRCLKRERDDRGRGGMSTSGRESNGLETGRTERLR